MEKEAKILIVGDNDVTGISLKRYFKANGFKNILGNIACDVDLISQNSIFSFFKKERPEYVFLLHIQSGGISANMKYPAELIYNNLQAQNNVIHYSYKFGVKKLLFLGSSCVYPKESSQPIKEEHLLSGKLEETNESYAVARIAGIQMCKAYNQQYKTNFISVVPATVYGPEGNFDLEESHVISALIRKFYEAKINKAEKITIWGKGTPRREFIYVDDLVDACIFLMDNYDSSELINVGYGEDISIKELVLLIREISGFEGEIVFDESKPDGVFQKLLDTSKMTNLDWKPKISLKEGITKTYKWYIENYK